VLRGLYFGQLPSPPPAVPVVLEIPVAAASAIVAASAIDATIRRTPFLVRRLMVSPSLKLA